ncbi:c-type cytochrome [Bradyrhizobium cenepequi]|uniref:c-type cytochrome n=1 Tax=Bradyrhizobium cenepequi TaxID=2821403 RepID=UPI001CE345C1|nr:c-type cytochrome [Bradyrhizobium cenepequi]MCA6111483.1 c-type cytochrome [Bradyrhizobium cenepequi]
MQNIVGLVALIAIAALLARSGFRTWRVKNRIVKWGGAGLLALLSVAVLSAGALTSLGMIKQHSRSAPIPDIKVAATPELIARGKDIADGLCGACHSHTGTLTGGYDLAVELQVPIGSFVAANLTPAGPLRHWSDGEIFRAIRNGVDAEGRWLTMMSYVRAGRLSDDDIKAVIAYIRSVPAAGNPTPDPPDHMNMLGLAMLGAGMLPSGKPIITGHISGPLKGPTFELGEYILAYQDCRECHGENLTGGVPGQLAPLGPDLNLVKDWTLAGFIAAMRTGIDPNGHEISEKMPWRSVGKMDDDELAAIYQYLTHMPNS